LKNEAIGMSTEGFNDQKQAKATNVTRRTLAVFVSVGAKHALRPCEIAYQIKEDYHAVYSAIRRFCKHKFVKRIRRRFGKTYYILADKEAALEYLESNLAILGGIPRSLSRFFRGWLDLDRAVLEHVGPVSFVVDGYITDVIRGFLKRRGRRVRRGDRAKQLSFPFQSFSLKISVHGRVGFWIKSLDWISDFNDFLIACGLDDANRAFVFRKIAEKVQRSNASVEIPVLSDDVPKGITIKTKAGDASLVSRISSTHFPRELEVRGTFGAVQNFLTALAGSQHFSMLEWLQADRLDKINRVLHVLSKSYDRTARALESVTKESVASKLEAQQEETEGRRKSDRYIV